jgi:integrase
MAEKRTDKTGTLERRADGTWTLRLRLPSGQRPRIVLPGGKMTPARARETADALLEQVPPAEIAARFAAGPGAAAPAPFTVKDLGDAWTSGKLLREHGRVYGLKEKASAGDDVYRLGRCYPVRPRGGTGPTFGDLPVADVTEEDVAVVLREIAHRDGAPLAANTIRNYHALLHRLFELAERPCRLRPRGGNPVDPGLRPAADEEKLHAFLLPEELLKFLGCSEVPLHYRVAALLGVYLGLRKGNLMRLTWGDLDFKSGTFTAKKTKTGVPLRASLHFESVEIVLQRWHERLGRPGPGERVIDLTDEEWHRSAKWLRELLQRAGVTRADLFAEDDPHVEPLRFHDLRGSFVTWSRRGNLGDDFITARTGHLTEAMVRRYTRAATSVDAARFIPFPDVSNAIPELAQSWPTARNSNGLGGGNDPEPEDENAAKRGEADGLAVFVNRRSGVQVPKVAPNSPAVASTQASLQGPWRRDRYSSSSVMNVSEASRTPSCGSSVPVSVNRLVLPSPSRSPSAEISKPFFPGSGPPRDGPL